MSLIQETYPVLGAPLCIASNDARILALADRVFGYWSDLDPALIDEAHRARIDFIVEPEHTAPPLSGRIRYRHHEGIVLGTGPGFLLSADRNEGRGLVFVHPNTTHDELLLRRYIVEYTALLLATRHDRAPLHAAAVAKNGKVLLLAGPSGAGKTSLLYGLYRAGVPIIAEETVCIAQEPELRMWGHVSGLGLAEDAVTHFEELSKIPTRQMPNGKTKRFIDCSGTKGEVRLGTATGEIILVILERYGSPLPLLQTISPASAVATLRETREPGLEEYGGSDAAIDTLVAHADCQQLSTAMSVNRCVDELLGLLAS